MKKSIFSRRTKALPTEDSDMPAPETQTAPPPTEHSLTEKLGEAFDAAFYLSQNSDVLAAGLDPFEHYKLNGWREKRAPNSWFDPLDYVTRHPDLADWETNPFLHFLERKGRSEETLEEELRQLRHNQLIYWSDLYWDGEDGTRPVVISTSLPNKEEMAVVQNEFDAEFYLAQNPDVAAMDVDPLLHFMTVGWIERRDPSPDFSLSYYLRHNRDIRRQRMNPYLHYLNHGRKETWRKSASVAEARILGQFEADEAIQADIAAAKVLEPMVAMPNTPRRITSPLASAEKVTDVAKALRKALAGKTYRYVIAVPHVRMSGASRVASIFADALSRIKNPSEILVVTTDSSDQEYIGWFSEDLDIFDLSKYVGHLEYENRIRALIDMMRGVQCKTLINVNSRLVWEGMRMYGRQLHNEYRIVTYLFTWDENPQGDRVGYPIQWLRDTADHHHLLLTDTQNLARDVADRLGFGQMEGEGQVLPLYTPAGQAMASANRKMRRNDMPRVLWAGRFDPQKRIDLLVAIAKANPSITFDVYGKTVLGNQGFEQLDPPDNLVLKGTYTELQDVLDTPYSGFLYTAQWDGLPTILLDMATAGLPIIAPDVGGIAEMIDNSTGWLIDDFEDIEAYSMALVQMVRSPTEADNRARALQARLATQFSDAGYIENIKKMVADYDL